MNFADMPYAPIRSALDTILGRIVLVLGTLFLAGLLGVWTATASFAAVLNNCLSVPMMSLFTLFYGHGLITWPLILGFTIGFVRYEWRWRWLLVPLFLAWWDYHAAFDYTLNRSVAAKMQKQMNEAMATVQREQAEQKRKKAE